MTFFKFSFPLFILFYLQVGKTADAQLMRNQLQLEAELTSQVKKELLQILKKDEFVISSSIKLKSYKVTKVL